MAIRDWDQEQARFLAAHKKSGISPQDWCEQVGLKYSTAKRYIKISGRTDANSQKKPSISANSQRLSPTTIGRPSSYHPSHSDLAERLCKLGLTDLELAEVFCVSEQTINAWKKKHPEFLESIKKGKLIADAGVAEKLFQRATGYEHPEDDIRAVDGRIVITPTTKHYPPDTTAAIFWLKNRQPEKWRDKQEVEHSGEVNLVDRILAARKRARGEHDK